MAVGTDIPVLLLSLGECSPLRTRVPAIILGTSSGGRLSVCSPRSRIPAPSLGQRGATRTGRPPQSTVPLCLGKARGQVIWKDFWGYFGEGHLGTHPKDIQLECYCCQEGISHDREVGRAVLRWTPSLYATVCSSSTHTRQSHYRDDGSGPHALSGDHRYEPLFPLVENNDLLSLSWAPKASRRMGPEGFPKTVCQALGRTRGLCGFLTWQGPREGHG